MRDCATDFARYPTGVYVKHQQPGTIVSEQSTPAASALRWRSDSYQVNGDQKGVGTLAGQTARLPGQLNAVELTKLSYPDDGHVSRNFQGISRYNIYMYHL